MAWSVARTTNAVCPLSAPVTFDRVLLNLGNAWSSSTSKITIPHTGYYLTHISAGLQAGHGIYFNINGSPKHYIVRNSSVHNGVDTMSKTVVQLYQAGAEFTIGCTKAAPSAIYSDARMQTTYSGILLFQA